MHLTVRLERSTDDHPGNLFDGDLRPAKAPTPRGLLELETPPLELPSGIPLAVRVVYDPEHDTGDLAVVSTGIELAHVAPLRTPLYLSVRLASDEVVCISVTLLRPTR